MIATGLRRCLLVPADTRAVLARLADERESPRQDFVEIARALDAETLSFADVGDGAPLFTRLSMVSLLVFYIYALQCLPTSVVVAKEAGSWRWALGQFIFMSGFAYLAALAVFQSGKLLGF